MLRIFIQIQNFLGLTSVHECVFYLEVCKHLVKLPLAYLCIPDLSLLRCFISAEMFYHLFYFDMIITVLLQCFISCQVYFISPLLTPWSRCIAYNVLLQLLFAPLTFNLHDCRNNAWVVLFTSIWTNTASSCVVLFNFLAACSRRGLKAYESRYSDHTYRLAYAVV